MSVRSSDSQTPSVSCDTLGESSRRFVFAWVWVSECVLCLWRVCCRKEVRTKNRGSIIGFNPARRHNDTAIDSTMSSRERLTNRTARACFSQPPIGWWEEAVGLQVAEWTLERGCSLPSLLPASPSCLPRLLEEDRGRCGMWQESCDLEKQYNRFTCATHHI